MAMKTDMRLATAICNFTDAWQEVQKLIVEQVRNEIQVDFPTAARVQLWFDDDKNLGGACAFDAVGKQLDTDYGTVYDTLLGYEMEWFDDGKEYVLIDLNTGAVEYGTERFFEVEELDDDEDEE